MMEKIKADDYSEDYEETLPREGKGKRKEKGSPTKSDKERRKQEIQAVRLARVEEAEKRIAKHLSSSFKHLETDKDQKQIKSYLEWLKDSLERKSPRLNPEDEKEVKVDSFVSSVKAGGQHRQKNRTAVRLTHLPTLISVKNENERSFEQNKQQAKAALFEKLEEHLELWQTLVENSLTPIDIENKVFSLAKTLSTPPR